MALSPISSAGQKKKPSALQNAAELMGILQSVGSVASDLGAFSPKVDAGIPDPNVGTAGPKFKLFKGSSYFGR